MQWFPVPRSEYKVCIRLLVSFAVYILKKEMQGHLQDYAAFSDDA